MFAKTFRNTLIASSLLIGASLLAGPAALAQEVTGVITAESEVTFSPALLTPIDNGAAVAAYSMGTLAVQNDAPLGWTLEVSSLNGGELRNTVTPLLHAITYTQITTEDLGASEATAQTLSVAEQDYLLHDSVFDAAVAEGVSLIPVTAAIAADQFVPAGTYADTLTFTLTSKVP